MDPIEQSNSLIQAAKQHFQTTETELPDEIGIQMNLIIQQLEETLKQKRDEQRLPALKEILDIYNSILEIMELNAKRLKKRIKTINSSLRLHEDNCLTRRED